MLEKYKVHVEQREALGVPPLPLDVEQVVDLVQLLQAPPVGEESLLTALISERIPSGVDEAAYVKASFLAAIVNGEATSPLVDSESAIELLGTMQGGYSVDALIALLEDERYAKLAGEQLKKTILMFDSFHDVVEKYRQGNSIAGGVIRSWAEAEWFTSRPAVQSKYTLTVFKVSGETNTDDLSPATDVWSRPDVPLHARSMLKNSREGIIPDEPGVVGPLSIIDTLKAYGYPIVYVGDVVGTGSSRKSAINSLLWHFGDNVSHVPNKRVGGFCFAGKIAPIFYNTLEDAGSIPLEIDVSTFNTGDIIDLYLLEGKICRHLTDDVLVKFPPPSFILLDQVRAGGRIPLIIGQGLTNKARDVLGLEPSDVFAKRPDVKTLPMGYTLAQKIVGKACGLSEGTGVRPGSYCEATVTTVGSPDTTGPLTRDELKDLACLGFSADLVMQSFCHTAAYPKPVDIKTQHTLPDFIKSRGGVVLKPGDGIIHSWLNRMLLPDTVGTGGDSHTRFPIGISFPAGSALVAFASATGVMPLNMPESILVRFKGEMRPGVTLRDLVHSIPLFAIKHGLLTTDKKNKVNEFSGKIIEIEGLEHLTVEQAFELSDASAERSAAGCSIKLSEKSVASYLRSNVDLLRWLVRQGYGDPRTLERRALKMEEWLNNPILLRADEDAVYADILEIDVNLIDQPIVCAPNDPDDARFLSDVAGVAVDEVFIGSCMTNIGHFRAAAKILETAPGTLPTRLWISPPTKMDQRQLMEEGYYGTFGRSGARLELPGCSLCMGNQARVSPNSTVVSTSTRNFPNRLGDGANVFLASAELAAVTAILGRLPTPVQYGHYAEIIASMKSDVYRYLNFDEIEHYRTASRTL